MKAIAALGTFLGFALASGCSAGGDASSQGPLGTGSATGTGSTGPVILDPGSRGGSNTGPTDVDGSCKAVEQRAEKSLGGKADIIWVLDNSGSMGDEAAGIQQQMNFFSSFIAGTGIDVRVVAVSSAPGPLILGLAIPPYGLCIAPPLGSGQPCPNDSNPPPNGVYMHVLQEVDSHNALEQLMNTYPQWQSMVRPDSSKTIVVVTDDEANPTPTTAQFIDFFNQQFAGSVWRFSGVFCVPGGIGGANCANTGTTYAQVVSATGGVAADLSQPDWGAVFRQLGDAVIADARPVDCEWVIPPPPAGQTFDPAKVNVRFTPSSGVAEPVFAAGDAGKCSDQFLGWHYDSDAAPTKVIACPQTCPTLQGDNSAKIEVLFGCATELPPIM